MTPSGKLASFQELTGARFRVPDVGKGPFRCRLEFVAVSSEFQELTSIQQLAIGIEFSPALENRVQ
jgi:hypothetical protein